MAQKSRSITEYVKNKLGKQLWAALEEYLGSADFSVLELRLNNITKIGMVNDMFAESRNDEYKGYK